VLSALDYSHRMGIIHRDIKPGNVMLTPSGDVKVMDFGIARAVSDASSTMTQTAAVVGTAQYLSPEQARGENVDARSDVYSTGCLLYELLTGRPPFVGESPVSVAYQHVREQAPVPSALDADLPPEIDAIVMKALAKSVTERYPSASAMKADIDRYLAGHPIQAPAPVVAPMAGPATTVLPATPGPGTAETPAAEDDARRRSRGLIILGVILLALIVAAVWGLPKLIGSHQDQRAIPDLYKLSQAAAQQKIAADGFAIGNIKPIPSANVPTGQVVRQNPAAGNLADPGTSIDIWVSSGKPSVQIPNVLGQNKDAVAARLSQLKLVPVLKERKSDDPQGNVIELNPAPGTQVAPGSRVKVFYSSGPTTLPNVVGMSEAKATKTLTDAGFKVTVFPDSTSTAPKGQVTRQSPDGGQPEPQGTVVTILVSTYEPPSPTPSPTTSPSPSATTSPSPGNGQG
jgi:serine/threonine-protein kinase